jgi:hypothetical protein
MFGGPIEKKITESNLIFDGLISFDGFAAQFSTIVNGSIKIGYNFLRPT